MTTLTFEGVTPPDDFAARARELLADSTGRASYSWVLNQLRHDFAGPDHEIAFWLGQVIGEDRERQAARRRPAHQLSGDARLQFWREAFVVALPPLIQALGLQASDSLQLAFAAGAARGVADMALAAHLARNEPGALERIVELVNEQVTRFEALRNGSG